MPGQRLRLLIIAPTLEIVGGQSDQAHRLRTGLAQEPAIQVDFLPINPQFHGFLNPLHKIRYIRTFFTELWFLLTLIPACLRADLIHVFAATGPSFYLHPVPALVLARLFGRKIVLHFHDGRIETYAVRHPGLLRRISRFDAVVVPSGYLVEVFARHGVRARAISNVIDVEAFPFRERPSVRPRLLHNRALEPLYNVPCTLRAFGLIQQRYPDATLRMAHDGPLRAGLEKMTAELGLRNVEFLGPVSREDTPRILDEADIYFTSSNVDNMPVSILECFAAGLPVVATRAGGIPWLIENERTGLLVDLDDHEALANAAIRLIDEPGLASRLAHAAKIESAKYGWPEVRMQWLRLYEALAPAQKRRDASAL